jgi:hypothetical protein
MELKENIRIRLQALSSTARRSVGAIVGAVVADGTYI